MNAYYHSVENLSSNLLFKHTNIKICRTMNLSVLLRMCEASPLTFKGRIKTEGDEEQDSKEDSWV